MPKFKAALHNHTSDDPKDPIKHSADELCDLAIKEGYKIVAITCHNKVTKIPKRDDILVIPGTEQEIAMRHIVILNAKPEAEKIFTYKALRAYKKKHPESLIMAAHPYFPGPNIFNDTIRKNIDCFDAVELSWWYTKWLNFNKRGEKLAKKFNLPFIATPDTHNLRFFGTNLCEIDAKELTIESVIQALKTGKFKNITHPVSIWTMLAMPFIALKDKTWLAKETLIRWLRNR